MKIYVAGKWYDRGPVRVLQAALRECGHEITVDWTDHESPKDERMLVQYALQDIQGVREADMVVALMERPYDYRGAWVEIGAALALDKPVSIIGRHGDSCIFIHHPAVERFLFMGDFLKYGIS